MLHDIDRELAMQKWEKHYVKNIQDSPELRGRRIFGRGGQRQLTGAEIAEKELKKNDREEEQTTKLKVQVIDLTGSPQRSSSPLQSFIPIAGTSRCPPRPFIMIFSTSGQVIQQSSCRRPQLSQSAQISTVPTSQNDPNVIVISREKVLTVATKASAHGEKG